MLNRAILVALLWVTAWPAALAQEPRHSAPTARLIALPPPPEPDLPVAPISNTGGEVAVAPAAPADNSPPQMAADDRGTAQSPLAVTIIPAPVSEAEGAKAAAEQQDRALNHLWMIGLTIAVAGLTLWQLIALLTLTRTARQQLRAYLFVSRAEIVDLEMGMPIVQVDIKNTGQTPAYNVTHVWRCGSFAYPLTEKLPLPLLGEPIAWAHLGPGAIVQTHRTAEKKLGNGTSGTELSNRPLAFYVYGEIVYRDAFHKRRFTRYVFFHDGLPRMGPGHLIAHARGNEAN
jgi:hypothetical protein